MQTAYDWITVLIFAGLVTHFLATSVDSDGKDISVWHYLLASVGCACVNWLGNEGQHLFAILLLVGVGVYIFYFLSPHLRPPKY